MNAYTNVTWIVVANKARVRIFVSKDGISISELDGHLNPEAHPRSLELLSSIPAPNNFDVSGSNPQQMDASVGVTETEVEHFAKAIAKQLELEAGRQTFQKFYLISPPAFLGQLRQNLSSKLQGMLADEIKKDLLQAKPEQIREYLPKLI